MNQGVKYNDESMFFQRRNKDLEQRLEVLEKELVEKSVEMENLVEENRGLKESWDEM